MVNIAPMEIENKTKTSRFIEFLVKVCFLPIATEDNGRRIRFKPTSCRTLVHMMIYWGTFLLLSLCMLWVFDDVTLIKLMGRNGLESIAASSTGLQSVALIFPILLARGLDHTKAEMVLDGVQFPAHGVKTIVSYFGVNLGGKQTAPFQCRDSAETL